MQSLSQARLWVFLEKNRVRVRKVLWFLCGSPERGLGRTRAGVVEWGGEVVGKGMQDSGQGMGCSVAEPRRDLRPMWGPVEGWMGRGHPEGGIQEATVGWHSTSGNSSEQRRVCPEQVSWIKTKTVQFLPPPSLDPMPMHAC